MNTFTLGACFQHELHTGPYFMTFAPRLCPVINILSSFIGPFQHSTSVRSNNGIRARLGWTFSCISCIFELAPLVLQKVYAEVSSID